MSKNDFLARQRVMQQTFFDAGLQMGRQQILDLMVLTLRDPEYVGKDTFGAQRLLKIIQGIGAKLDYFEPAWRKHDEADYYQTKLDAALAEAFGNKLQDSFHKRYEYCKEQNPKTGRWTK